MNPKEILSECWKGKDIWFPDAETVVFEGNDEGMLDFTWLTADDASFRVNEERGQDDSFYEIYNAGKTIYRAADSIDETLTWLEQFAGIEAYDVTTYGQAIKAIEEVTK